MQTLTRPELRKWIPTAAAALLFAALLAQAPHAAYVFIRIGQEGAFITIVGGIVYAIALESATAYFVWNNKMRWAIAFAAFSIMHNIAYYMPEAWTFNIAGAQLTLRFIVSALLISASLPIAIAAFSHVHVSNKQKHATAETPAETPTTNIQPVKPAKTSVALPAVTLGYSSEVPPEREEAPEQQPEQTTPKATKEQRRALIAEWQLQNTQQVMDAFGIKKRTADEDLAFVRKNVMHTNGVAK